MKPDAMLATNGKSLIVVLCIALAVLTSAVYWQVGEHQFLNLDDDAYVTDNSPVARGLTVQNITWAVTSLELFNWHPVTWLSHMVDVQLYGMNPRGHHLTNVAIHTASALLLFLLLVRMTGGLWQSLFVAALFALHPLHVESVAWVAERKDVLSSLFLFITLLFYAEYVAKRKLTLYILSLFSFVLGLMSKPMLVTLPLVMLLLNFWPLDRIRCEVQKFDSHRLSGRLAAYIKEIIPFFACSLLSGLVTIYAQNKGGAVRGFDEISLQLRSENALIAYIKYIGKTIWPHDLAVFYPFPASVPLWQTVSSLLTLLLISVAVIRGRRRYPYLTVGWFWFLITLLPVIGLIQVGGQAMADRYSYIPVTGLFIMTAWGVPHITGELQHRKSIHALLASVIIAASAAVTWQQTGYWRNNISLYQHTLKITAGNSMIHNNLGNAFAAEGNLDAAIQQFRKALQTYPGYADAHNNLGTVLQAQGDLNAAIHEYQEALRISPNHAKAHNNLGTVLAIQGNLDAAIREFQEALRIKPNIANVSNNLKQVLAKKRMQNEAR